MNDKGTSLLEACDPIFQIVSRILADHRVAAGPPEMASHAPPPTLSLPVTPAPATDPAGTVEVASAVAIDVAAEVDPRAPELVARRYELQQHVHQAFGDAEKLAVDRKIDYEFTQVRRALEYFVDGVMVESELPFSAAWNEDRIALQTHGCRTGDSRFFTDHLEPALQDRSEAGRHRLDVLFCCLSLGFRGIYRSPDTDPDGQRFAEVLARCRRRLDVGGTGSAVLCPEADRVSDEIGADRVPWPFVGLVLVLLVTSLMIVVSLIAWDAGTGDYGRAIDRAAALGAPPPPTLASPEPSLPASDVAAAGDAAAAAATADAPSP